MHKIVILFYTPIKTDKQACDEANRKTLRYKCIRLVASDIIWPFSQIRNSPMKPLQILVSALCICELFGDAEAQAALPICTKAGVFEIVDGTCKNYYLCVDNGQILIPVVLSCADFFIFDPVMGICVSDSAILCRQTTTVSPITTSAPFCVRYGRFPIPSKDCKRYYLCYWDGTRYSMVMLSCPNLLVFHPLLEKCVSPQTYNCTFVQG